MKIKRLEGTLVRKETQTIWLKDKDGNTFEATYTRKWEDIKSLSGSEEVEILPSIKLKNGKYLKPDTENKVFLEIEDESKEYYLL